MAMIFDIETDGLDPTKIHCVCWRFDTDKSGRIFSDSTSKLFVFRKALKKAKIVVGHGIIGYDLPALKKLHHLAPPKICTIIDTFVVSRLKDYLQFRTHSLGEWGSYLEFPKGDPPEKWDIFTKHMLDYCKLDVELTYKVFEDLREFIYDKDNSKALKLEHDIAIKLEEVSSRGFTFDSRRASLIRFEMSEELYALQKSFDKIPAKTIIEKKGSIRKKKDGSLYSTTIKALSIPGVRLDCDDIVLETKVPFNPNSHSDRMKLLNSSGWLPTEKTDAHYKAYKRGVVTPALKETGWKVSETNLATLPDTAPQAAKNLAQYLTLNSRKAMLDQWIFNSDINGDKVCGKIWGIGAWTHRCSHSSPNMANPPATFKGKPSNIVEVIKDRYDKRLRALFTSPGSLTSKLIGFDAKSIQLRVLAHYMKDPEFTEEVCSGDIHTANQKALGTVCKTRFIAKTFIYAWVLGAGIPMVASILSCSIPQASKAMSRFKKKWSKGLANVEAFKLNAIKKGYFIGLDGRKVKFPSDYKVLAGMLQNGEAIIMKKTLIKLPWHWKVHGFIHDEVQLSNRRFTPKETYEIKLTSIGTGIKHELFDDKDYEPSIEFDIKIGDNWAETH